MRVKDLILLVLVLAYIGAIVTAIVAAIQGDYLQAVFFIISAHHIDSLVKQF